MQNNRRTSQPVRSKAGRTFRHGACNDFWLELTQPTVHCRFGPSGGRQPTEAAIPALEFGDRVVQTCRSEIRPQRPQKQEFRVRRFPEQKVTEALLTPGADEQ